MISLALTLSIISLVFVAAGIVFILRLYLNPKDDPRLGRGLQILQSKISVVEDLSKQVDRQSDQIISLLEHKIKEVQEKIFSLQIEEEKLSQKQAELKSIIRLFQDRVPFEEIAQRQLTVKYVRAAKLAHQGKSVEEISRLVELPFSELNMICKMNREQLVFSEENLPDWVEERLAEKPDHDAPLQTNESQEQGFEPQPLIGAQDRFDFTANFTDPASKLNLEEPEKAAQEPLLVMPKQTQASMTTSTSSREKIDPTAKKKESENREPLAKPSFSLKGDVIQVQKVQFPRIDVGNVI